MQVIKLSNPSEALLILSGFAGLKSDRNMIELGLIKARAEITRIEQSPLAQPWLGFAQASLFRWEQAKRKNEQELARLKQMYTSDGAEGHWAKNHEPE